MGPPPFTLDVPAVHREALAIGPSPAPAGRLDSRNGRQHLSVWYWGCCRRDGNGKRGQTTLHRITPFFSWASASSREQGLAATLALA